MLRRSALVAVLLVGSAIAAGAPGRERPLGPNELPWERAAVGRILDALARGDAAVVTAEVNAWDADPVALAWGTFLGGLAEGGDRARAETAVKAIVAASTRGPMRGAFVALVGEWAGWTGEAVERERRLVDAATTAQRLVRAGKGKEAIAAVQAAEADMVAASRSPSAAWLRNIDRSIARAAEEAPRADARTASARAAAEALPWPECVSIIDANHGIAIRRRGRSEEAESALNPWIDVRSAELSPYRVAVLRSVRCDVRLERNRLEGALDDARGAAATFAANGEASYAAGARGSVARVLHRMGRASEAGAEAVAALDAARSAGNAREVARATALLGMLASDAGRLPLAASRFREAADIAAKAGQTDVQAHALANLGQVEMRIGSGDATFAALGEAISLRRKAGDLVGVVKVAMLRGLARAKVDQDGAIAELRALDEELKGRIPAAHRGRILVGIGCALSETDRGGEEEGVWAEAIPLLETGSDPADLAFAKSLFARLRLRQGRNDDAQRILASIGDLDPALDVGVRATASISIGLGRLEAGDVRGAIDALRWVVDLWAFQASSVADAEAGQRGFYAERATGYLLACALALPSEERAAQAFAAMESGRSLALAGALLQRDALLAARVTADVREGERASREEIRRALETFGRVAAGARSAGTPVLAEARSALDRAYARRTEALAKVGREVRAAVESLTPTPIDLPTLRAAIGPDDAYLAWHVARTARATRLVGLAVTRTEALAVDLGDAPALLAKAAGWSDLLSAPGSNEAALATSLYDALVRPLEPVLGPARRWIASPPGEMSLLPIGALRRSEGGAARRVVERVEVLCVPSATVFAQLSGATRPRDGVGIVGVADPAPGPGSRTLPASRVEIDAILALHPPTRCVRLVGDEATEAALRVALEHPGTRLAAVQIATHGVFDEARPRLSGLVLAKGERLLFDDVASWRVDADLVVLSGCDTAKGPVRRGEGVLGFTHAFFLAGVPRVVVSSWSVADATTASFMAAFHAKMAKDRLAPAAALRAVQAERAAGTGAEAHPNAWAAFQLWGLPD